MVISHEKKTRTSAETIARISLSVGVGRMIKLFSGCPDIVNRVFQPLCLQTKLVHNRAKPTPGENSLEQQNDEDAGGVVSVFNKRDGYYDGANEDTRLTITRVMAGQM